MNIFYSQDFPGGSDGIASVYNAETWVWSLGWEDPLEKQMATHSSILAWEILWTKEPSRATVHGIAELNWAHNHTSQVNMDMKSLNKILPMKLVLP